MLAYRVFPFIPGASAGEPGHPLYLHRPQGNGRLDNPGHYDVWYLSLEAAGAIGETFGDIDEWTEDMFEFPALPGSRRALGTYHLGDDLHLLELDDASHLLDRGLRPSQVIERNRATTQEWALRIFQERNDRGECKWAGVRWWSFHRPAWRVLGIWGSTPEILQIETLSLSTPAVLDAGLNLKRPRIAMHVVGSKASSPVK